MYIRKIIFKIIMVRNMKGKFLISLILSSLLLVGCGAQGGGGDGGDEQYTPQDINARGLDLPTTMPKLDEPSFQIHYRREDNKYKDWGVWLWDPAGDDDGEVDKFNYQDDFGVTAYYPISHTGANDNRIGFIIRKLADWTKDYGSDRFIDLNTMEKDENDCYKIYVFSGDGQIYSNPNKAMSDAITTCAFTDTENINVVTTNKAESFVLYKNNVPLCAGEGMNSTKFKVMLPSNDPTVDMTAIYKLSVKFVKSQKTLSKTVSIANLYDSAEFNEAFTYNGELGAIYTKEATTFKVWSPVSQSVKLRIYANGTPTSVNAQKGNDAFDEYEMTKGEKGVYSKQLTGDLEGKYYTYVVSNANFTNKEIVDPYAKSAGVNGLRGMIVDFSKTNPEDWDKVTPIDYDRNELTVWETHVADMTSHSTWTGTEANRRKYLGMIEEGTRYTNNGVTVTTGFDHVKELGVNAVQILPFFDQANDETNYAFNWGYNPLNYNVMEGLYSSDPYDGYARIREVKQVVQAYNEIGVNIIMDVVYNHVNGADGSNFDVLMPGYYYRYNSNGDLSNGSGCGNETASEMPMMRKFMIDSARFLASEYKLGGFRFDLMGLHDLRTMKELTAACKTVNPNIVIYGEPWTGGDSAMKNFAQNSAKQSNGNQYDGYGAFNDVMRDALIKGGLNSDTATGWVTEVTRINATDVNNIKKGISGSTNASPEIADPNKTVNYVTCHDNYTLFDRVQKSALNVESENDWKKMCVLANAVVFTSQGTTFMLAGEEMLRTKKGNNNSYNAPDSINQYDYNRKIRFPQIFENYKALIKFKQDAEQLHASTCQIQVDTLDGGAVLKYKVTSGDQEFMVIHCNGVGATTSIDLSAYQVYWDTLGTNEVGSDLTASFVPAKFQTLIALKK